jgi:hypothetical protein
MQNGFCGSFNGRMREELLNESLFFGLDHARTRIALWANDYNGQARTRRWAISPRQLMPPISPGQDNRNGARKESKCKQ